MRPVKTNALALRSAEEFVNRNVQRACLDVDQRILDGGNGLLGDAALRGTGARIKPCGMHLEAARILADQQRCEFLDQRRHTAPAKAFVVFAPSNHAVVGGDFHEVEVSPRAISMQDVYALNLHVISFPRIPTKANRFLIIALRAVYASAPSLGRPPSLKDRTGFSETRAGRPQALRQHLPPTPGWQNDPPDRTWAGPKTITKR